MSRSTSSALVLCLVTFASAARAQWLEPDGTTLFAVAAPTVQDTFAWSVVSVGDITGDGLADLAASAPLFGNAAGKVELFSGANGSVIWTRNGPSTSAILGYALEVEDWNGDGVLDVLASAPFGAGPGFVYVFSGDTGATLHTFDPGNTANEAFGASIALGGDFDGDGVDDIAIGAITYDAQNDGRVYVYSGANAALITTIDGPALAGADGHFGTGLAFLGDVSVPLDGRDELVIGRREAVFTAGVASVFSFDGVSASELYSVSGVGMGYSLYGDRIDAGGDLDSDGYGDFFVGDPIASELEAFSGLDGSPLYTLVGSGGATNFGLGHFVPDVDGDGRPDLLIGANSDSTGAVKSGRVFLYSGASGQIVRTWTNANANERLGIDARCIGDFDGDGVLDFVIGGTGGGTSGPPGGRFRVVRGTTGFTTYCSAGSSGHGCVAQLSAQGRASVSQSSGFLVHANGVEGQKLGVFFWSTGRIEIPWGSSSSTMCLAPPRQRTPAQISGGTVGACDGSLHIDFNAWMSAGLGQTPAAGTVAYLQAMYRDPSTPIGSQLSNALAFAVGL